MAEPLKHHFGPPVVRELARQIAAVWPAFRARAFVADALDGFEALELMPRGVHLARVLRRHLPDDVTEAFDILLRSTGEPRARREQDGPMASFFFLPHVNFVALFGLDHFEAAMRAQHSLTQRFTAEFSIRPFLERHESATLARLAEWTADPSEHVRRLVSEGTRPRLPWAGRLRRFQADPAQVLALLERLKDDPSEYVRRSVANNLNDIGKDHPDVLVRVARRWLADAGDERRALVRHALRSLVKAGHPGALRVLGYGHEAVVDCRDVTFAPKRVANGGKVTITFSVVNRASRRQRVLVDLRVHFVKATGRTTPKVFKLKAADLAPGEHAAIRKTISLAAMTTRTHYAGRHVVDVLVNGRVTPLGAFTVV